VTVHIIHLIYQRQPVAWPCTIIGSTPKRHLVRWLAGPHAGRTYLISRDKVIP
jgi:hypothetical protein